MVIFNNYYLMKSGCLDGKLAKSVCPLPQPNFKIWVPPSKRLHSQLCFLNCSLGGVMNAKSDAMLWMTSFPVLHISLYMLLFLYISMLHYPA